MTTSSGTSRASSPQRGGSWSALAYPQYRLLWLATIAAYNPVTYMLAGLRAILSGGWEWSTIGQAFGAVLIVGAISMTLSLLALRSRVKRG